MNLASLSIEDVIRFSSGVCLVSVYIRHTHIYIYITTSYLMYVCVSLNSAGNVKKLIKQYLTKLSSLYPGFHNAQICHAQSHSSYTILALLKNGRAQIIAYPVNLQLFVCIFLLNRTTKTTPGVSLLSRCIYPV